MRRGATFTAAVQEGLSEQVDRLHHVPGVMYGTLPSNKFLMLPIKEFSLAYAMNSRGFHSGRSLSLIGADGIGKTSQIYTWFGWWIPYNIPCCHVETEGKPMDKDRILRCLHTNRALAEQMFSTITFLQAFEIVDAINQIEGWLRLIRDKKHPEAYVPEYIPAGVALDTFSKLMAPAEAVGYHMYAESEVKAKPGEKKKVVAKIQELGGGGSNFQHASLAHKWSRRLASILTKYNAFLILGRHQNDKIDMSAQMGGGSFIPADVKERSNRTSIGGKAFAQSVAYELVVTKEKLVRAQIAGQQFNTGRIARIDVTKNSYGPESRACQYTICLEPRYDTETEQEPTIDFSIGLGTILSKTLLLHIIEKGGSVSCKELEARELSPTEFSRLFHANTKMVDDLSTALKFVGSGLHFKVPELNTLFAPERTETIADALPDEIKEIEREALLSTLPAAPADINLPPPPGDVSAEPEGQEEEGGDSD